MKYLKSLYLHWGHVRMLRQHCRHTLWPLGQMTMGRRELELLNCSKQMSQLREDILATEVKASDLFRYSNFWKKCFTKLLRQCYMIITNWATNNSHYSWFSHSRLVSWKPKLQQQRKSCSVPHHYTGMGATGDVCCCGRAGARLLVRCWLRCCLAACTALYSQAHSDGHSYL